MSLFNTRKDRWADGKAKPHRHHKRYVKHKGVRSWWNRLVQTKRRRANDDYNFHQLRMGKDPDSLIWTKDNHPQSF